MNTHRPAMTPAQAAAAVRRARDAVAAAQAKHTLEQARLAEAVRDALAAGVPATELAQLLGVSRARVYQIRDGSR